MNQKRGQGTGVGGQQKKIRPLAPAPGPGPDPRFSSSFIPHSGGQIGVGHEATAAAGFVSV